MPVAAQADTLGDQIKALQGQVDSQQATANQLHGQANTLANQIASLNAQAAQVQSQIALNNAKLTKVNGELEVAQAQLAAKKQVLGENIRAIYQQSTITPIEMLASSKNFSDFIDKQQYLDTIKSHIQDALETINKLKAQLDKQQADIKGLLAQQQGLEATLADQRSQVASLLADTQGQEANYQADIKAKNGQIESLRAQQAAVLAAASRRFTGGSIPGASGGSGGACDNGNGNGGYPWCGYEQDAFADSGGWGYIRECVSWAGWRRYNMGRAVPGHWGNANTWDDNARSAGYSVNGTPEVGAIAQTDAGPYGHVAIVEAIQGSTVVVSEMNYDGNGHFRYGAYSASYFRYIH